MLNYLKLTNFKRHESLEINFGGGLQLIRAASEAGKSSMLQAIAYALYGARALPMSLAATVTYGKPETSLRVLLRFSFNGSEFEVERHKGGAELRGDGVTASGQAEVTAFVDRLFGCSAAVATSLMFANQGALRGALEGGPGAAVSLIEKLADVDALDRLVEKAQEHLPSGNTKLLEARITELAEVKPPVADFAELEGSLAKAQEFLAAATAQVELHSVLAATDTSAASKLLADAANAKSTLVKGVKTHADLSAEAEVEVPDLLDTQYYRDKATAQSAAAALRSQYAEFTRIDQYEHVATSAEEFADGGLAATYRQKAVQAGILQVTRELAQAEMAIIQGKLCDFCGKDFSEVPEVIAKNTACAALAEAAAIRMTALKAEAEVLAAQVQDVRETVSAAKALDAQMSRLPVEAFGGYPRKYKWVGGDVPELDTTDYNKLLREVEAKNSARQHTLARVEAARNGLAALDLPALRAVSDNLQAQVGMATELLADSAKWKSELRTSQNDEKQAQAEAVGIAMALAVAKGQFAAAQDSYAASQAALAKAKDDLSTYTLNNRVIKKIREARPLVAKQLWGTVLGTVSHYFSQVRGTQSVVTREGGGFLVDGKPVEGLSGSTLDALGLAIRIALTRTFLANVPWLILDEPAAACDNNREAAMLGVVASCGFPQVLMVSHSELGESFASSVVTF
jgi:DNA repair exonuclease SbcCD ATPase subunit